MNPDYPPYKVEATAPPPGDVTYDDVIPTSDDTKTPEGDNAAVTLERQTQAMYTAQLKDVSPEKEEMKKEVEEEKEVKHEPEAITVQEPPLMPKHRSRCVACGCPRVCCVRNFVFLWVVLFILVQGGPLAVLILDLLGMNTHGTTISRYCSEWGMKAAVCRVSKFDPIDFDSNCTQPAKDYKCLDVEVKLFRYDKTGPFADDVPLWRSEREYVLNASTQQQPHCFNLDVCKINPNKRWYEYRNQTQKDEKIMQEKIIYSQEGFVCYYKKMGEYDYIAFKENNTSFWSVLLWFFLPLAGILVCWLMLFVCLCWYCCPRQRYGARSKMKSGEENSEAEEGGESRYLMPYND